MTIPGGLTRPLPVLDLDLDLPRPPSPYWRAFAALYVALVAALLVAAIAAVTASTSPPAYVCPHDPPQPGDVCWQQPANGPDNRTDPA